MVLIRYLGRSGGHVKLMCFLLPSRVLDWDKTLLNNNDFSPSLRLIAGYVIKNIQQEVRWEG